METGIPSEENSGDFAEDGEKKNSLNLYAVQNEFRTTYLCSLIHWYSYSLQLSFFWAGLYCAGATIPGGYIWLSHHSSSTAGGTGGFCFLSWAMSLSRTLTPKLLPTRSLRAVCSYSLNSVIRRHLITYAI